MYEQVSNRIIASCCGEGGNGVHMAEVDLGREAAGVAPKRPGIEDFVFLEAGVKRVGQS